MSVSIVTSIQNLFSNYQFNTSSPFPAQQRTKIMKGLYLKGGPGNVVGTATATVWMVRGSNPGGGESFRT